MRLLGVVAFVSGLFLSQAASAQNLVAFSNLRPVGFCQLILSGVAVGLGTCAGGIPAKSAAAVMIAETANSRWRDDGTAPTTLVGMLMLSGSGLSYQGDLTAFQIIAVSGSPVIDIAFYAAK